MAMAKKRNLAPESSQLGEPPLKQHKSEEEQENLPVQEEKKAFEIKPFAWPPRCSICRGSSGFGPKFTSRSIRHKPLEAFRTRVYFPVSEPFITPFKIISRPACTNEDGSSSGQAILDSTSALPAFYYDRYESCITIAGADYCVIAADFNPGQLKISEISSKCVMASCGFQDDVKALQEALSAENLRYESEHNKPMSCPEMRRLFCDFQKCHPDYVFIVLSGLDSEGKGCFFHHYSIAPRIRHSGSRLTLAPIHNYELPAKDDLARLSETEAVKLARDVFESATNTGDKLEIVVLNASGVRHIKVDLRARRISDARLLPMQQKYCFY